MVASYGSTDRLSASALVSSQDLGSSPEAAFSLICEVEKWPVWLSFAKSVRRVDDSVPFGLGSEVAVRSAMPGEEEELYEVDQFLDGHIVSLVGAYSLRRRIDFRIERKSDRSKLVLRVDYPAYGGILGSFIDRMTARRRLDRAIEDSLVHFKGLVEFRDVPRDEILADF
jgi:hypothetical protein